MRVLLANPRGFCAGVHMAVDLVEQLLDAMGSSESLYVYHEIVHNRHVVARLEAKGDHGGYRLVELLSVPSPGDHVPFAALFGVVGGQVTEVSAVLLELLRNEEDGHGALRLG